MSWYFTFNDIWQYGDFVNTFWSLQSTWVYYEWIVNTVSPTIDFMYHNVLLNPIFIGLIVVLLVLSLFTFND